MDTGLTRLRTGAKTCDNSFVPGTDVALADGTTKNIEDIKVGDKVHATDPKTGKTVARPVLATITTEDDKHFVDLTITTDDGAASIIATTHHPFWDHDHQTWINAGDLKPGTTLRTPDGTRARITATHHHDKRQRTHNLTIEGLHTYHVLARATPILVHNCAAPRIRISPSAADWATKGAHMHIGGSEVRIFPTSGGGVGFEGIRLSNGMASARDVTAARNAVMDNPELRADLIAKARSAMADMNDHNWGNTLNRAAEMNFLIKALEKIT